MTDKSYLDEFGAGQVQPLSKQLIETFVTGHRDPIVKSVDLVTRLKDVMTQALQDSVNATESTDRQ